jgi:hypothetical protein
MAMAKVLDTAELLKREIEETSKLLEEAREEIRRLKESQRDTEIERAQARAASDERRNQMLGTTVGYETVPNTTIATMMTAATSTTDNLALTATTMSTSAMSATPLLSVGLVTTLSSATKTSRSLLGTSTTMEATGAARYPVGLANTFGVKLPIFKSTGDIEMFIHRFEQFCLTQCIYEAQKANLLLTALDDAAFTVITKKLSQEERKNYGIIKKHLLQCFDLLKEAGRKRLKFRQTKREAGQSLEQFYTSMFLYALIYTNLLGLVTKAFPAETGATIDEMITDQFRVGCDDDKVRLHLIEKSSTTSKEALQYAVSYQAALRYNDTLRNNVFITSTAQFAQPSCIMHGREERKGQEERFCNEQRCEEEFIEDREGSFRYQENRQGQRQTPQRSSYFDYPSNNQQRQDENFSERQDNSCRDIRYPSQSRGHERPNSPRKDFVRPGMSREGRQQHFTFNATMNQQQPRQEFEQRFHQQPLRNIRRQTYSTNGLGGTSLDNITVMN